MNLTNQQNRDYRKRKAAKLPYYHVQQTLPLGETPAVRASLRTEGLWELVTADLREVYYYKVDQNKKEYKNGEKEAEYVVPEYAVMQSSIIDSVLFAKNGFSEIQSQFKYMKNVTCNNISVFAIIVSTILLPGIIMFYNTLDINFLSVSLCDAPRP